MKLFSQIESDIVLDEFIDEGLLDFISDIFGSKAARISGGIKKFAKNSKELPIKVRAIYKITVSSIKDIVDKNEKVAVEELLSSYKEAESIDEIATLNYKYLKTNRFNNSKFTYNLIYFTKELCVQSKNPQVRNYINELSDISKKQKVSTNIEKKSEEIVKKVKDSKKKEKPIEEPSKKEEPSKEEEKPIEEPSKEEEKSAFTNDDNDTKEEEVIDKEKVKEIINENPIKFLAQKVNIDSDKLYNIMFQKVADDKSLIDNADDIIMGLSAITCGALLIKNNEKMKTILKDIGIDDSENFMKNIEKVAK